MSEYVATIEWVRGDQPFLDNKYARAHDWRFDGGAVVRGSSAPGSVPVPLSDPAAVDPEKALVAAVSSCHMLFFLAYAAKDGFVVDRYLDQQEVNSFGELVAVNRGLSGKVFNNIAEAESWLLGT